MENDHPDIADHTWDFLKPRQRIAVQLRKQRKTFREMGELMGMGAASARTHYENARMIIRSGPRHISVRAANILNNNGLNESNVVSAIESGQFHPKKTRELGWKTFSEICKCYGISVPEKLQKPIKRPQLCPHCGKSINKNTP